MNNNDRLTYRQAAKKFFDIMTGRYAMRPEVLKQDPARQRKMVDNAQNSRKAVLICWAFYAAGEVYLAFLGPEDPSGFIFLAVGAVVMVPLLMVLILRWDSDKRYNTW